MAKNNCPLCGSRLFQYHSLHKKYCASCKEYFDWPLTEGQKSTLIDGVTAETVALVLETQPITSKEYEDESHGEN